jgi:hypothetical protein
MTYQVNAGLAGGRLARGQDCGLWFHWECAGTNSDYAILPWYCNSYVQAKVIKIQEETMLSLRRELELEKLRLAS